MCGTDTLKPGPAAKDQRKVLFKASNGFVVIPGIHEVVFLSANSAIYPLRVLKATTFSLITAPTTSGIRRHVTQNVFTLRSTLPMICVTLPIS
eukprot:3734138-Rhodomonas_salina.1